MWDSVRKESECMGVGKSVIRITETTVIQMSEVGEGR